MKTYHFKMILANGREDGFEIKATNNRDAWQDAVGFVAGCGQSAGLRLLQLVEVD